jgi:hypothetical protein
MGRKPIKRRRRCIYCQAADATTADHVPPKGLFPRPCPSTFITAPCCEGCNQAVSCDDDYFRAAIINRRDVPQTPAVKDRIEAVFRGLARSQATGFKQAFLAATAEVEITTLGGLYLGTGLQFTPELDRLETVATRTVRGLYFKEVGEPLPLNCRVTAYMDAGFDDREKVDGGSAHQIIRRLTTRPPRVVHDEIFQYWHEVATEVHQASLWLLLFYRSVWFLVFTTPPI